MNEQTQVEQVNMDMDSFLSGLLESIDNEQAEELGIKPQATEGFKIESEEQANYFLKKYKELIEEQEAILASSQKALDDYSKKVQAYIDRTCKPLANRQEFIFNALHEFMKNHMEQDPNKKKTLKMIEGDLSIKTPKPEYVYEEEVLLKYLKDDDELKKAYVKEKVEFKTDKVSLKKDAVVKNGCLLIGSKIIDGVKVVPRQDEFYIK